MWRAVDISRVGMRRGTYVELERMSSRNTRAQLVNDDSASWTSEGRGINRRIADTFWYILIEKKRLRYKNHIARSSKSPKTYCWFYDFVRRNSHYYFPYLLRRTDATRRKPNRRARANDRAGGRTGASAKKSYLSGRVRRRTVLSSPDRGYALHRLVRDAAGPRLR